MTTHDLKCWPEPFQAVVDGTKRHEVRRADRDFKVGDVLDLREWDPTTHAVYDHAIDCAYQGGVSDCNCNREAVREVPIGYTGRSAQARITYVSAAGTWGLPADLCVLSIALLNVLTITSNAKGTELTAEVRVDRAELETALEKMGRGDRDSVHRLKGPGRR